MRKTTLSRQLTDIAEAAPADVKQARVTERPVEQLLHELQVHQIELEMQNETLRQSRLDFEESRDRYLDLYDFAPVGYLTLTESGQIAEINLTGATLLGAARSKLVHGHFTRFVVAEDQDRWHRYFAQAFRSGGKQSCELGLKRGGGKAVDARLDSLLTTTGDALPTLRITLTDISESRRADLALQAANDQLASIAAKQALHLHELASELTRAEQRERDRLCELLHDDLQPLLVGTRLSLSSLCNSTPPLEMLRIAAAASAQIGQVIQVARTLSLQLSPPLIRERGLNAALEFLCRWVKDQYGLEVTLACAADGEPDGESIRLLCFNAVRELLMNVVKHAGVSCVTVTLTSTDRVNLTIAVADRGSGFDASAATTGTGLVAIERRLGMIGGALHIDTQPDQGTVVTISVPLHPVSATGWRDGRSDRRKTTEDQHAQDIDCR